MGMSRGQLRYNTHHITTAQAAVKEHISALLME